MKRLALLSFLGAVLTCGLARAQNPAVTVQGYHIMGPATSPEFPRWIADMKRWRMEYLKRLGYDDAEYKRPELLWTQSSFMQPQTKSAGRSCFERRRSRASAREIARSVFKPSWSHLRPGR